MPQAGAQFDESGGAASESAPPLTRSRTFPKYRINARRGHRCGGTYSPERDILKIPPIVNDSLVSPGLSSLFLAPEARLARTPRNSPWSTVLTAHGAFAQKKRKSAREPARSIPTRIPRLSTSLRPWATPPENCTLGFMNSVKTFVGCALLHRKKTGQPSSRPNPAVVTFW